MPVLPRSRLRRQGARAAPGARSAPRVHPQSGRVQLPDDRDAVRDRVVRARPLRLVEPRRPTTQRPAAARRARRPSAHHRRATRRRGAAERVLVGAIRPRHVGPQRVGEDVRRGDGGGGRADLHGAVAGDVPGGGVHEATRLRAAQLSLRRPRGTPRRLRGGALPDRALAGGPHPLVLYPSRLRRPPHRPLRRGVLQGR